MLRPKPAQHEGEQRGKHDLNVVTGFHKLLEMGSGGWGESEDIKNYSQALIKGITIGGSEYTIWNAKDKTGL